MQERTFYSRQDLLPKSAKAQCTRLIVLVFSFFYPMFVLSKIHTNACACVDYFFIISLWNIQVNKQPTAKQAANNQNGNKQKRKK